MTIKTLADKMLLFLVFIISAWYIVDIINTVIVGNFPFWYDPARDLISGLKNLSDITLIGQPSGIPGLFYGPYWIWLLSIGLFLSKDPRIVVFIAAVLPCIVLIPYVLFKLKQYLGKYAVLSVWLLFMYHSIQTYATNLWNPHVSIPLFFLLAYAVSIFADTKSAKGSFLIGVLVGLILNVHISLGLGVFVGTTIFLLVISFINNLASLKTLLSKTSITILSFFSGIGLLFLPFIIFELRHDFLQTKAILNMFDAAIHDIAVVGVVGFDKEFILNRFINIPSDLFFIPEIYGVMLVVLVFIFRLFYVYFNRKHKIDQFQYTVANNLIFFLICILGSLITIYMNSRNPVWEYHFIGIEVIVMLLISALVSRIRIIESIFIFTVCLLILNNYGEYVRIAKDWTKPNYAVSSLVTKEQIVDKIILDAQEKDYEVFIYNPSIYVFDYDYLFEWKAKKQVYFKPTDVTSSLRYVVIPEVEEAIEKDFIEYITPEKEFITTDRLILGDKTRVLKREQL